MADVKWIKIVTDIFDDEKILLIESLPEADGIIVIWFKLLTLAGKQNNNGVFMMSNRIPYTDEMLATIFRRNLNIVRLAIKTFEQFGMIEVVDNVITIPAWNKHQTLDAYEKKKHRDRLYQQERRAKQKLLIAGESSDASPDESPDVAVSEEDKEEDKKEDKKRVRETTPTLFERLLPEYSLSEAVADKMRLWIKYKTERKEPYKEQGMKSLLRQVENQCMIFTDSAVCDLIEECMANGWKGLIFDRLKNMKSTGNGGAQHGNTGKADSNAGTVGTWL